MTEPTPQQLRRDRASASWHEAGHVVACFEFKIPFRDVSVEPGWFLDTCSGQVRFRQSVEYNIEPRHDAIMSLAGGAAETVFRARFDLPEPDRGRWETDLACAAEALKVAKMTYQEAWAQATKLAILRWPTISAVATSLLARRRMTQGQARRVPMPAPLRT